MSDLISRFEEDLQLAGYAKRSIQSYAAGVRRLQRFHQKRLEDISEEDVRQYWLTCKGELGWSAATLRISYSAIKHFFTRTLVRPWPVHFKRDETLPAAHVESLQPIDVRHRRVRLVSVHVVACPSERRPRLRNSLPASFDFTFVHLLQLRWAGMTYREWLR